ncbi:prepilin-type N-terminal cleavage/methylation domain-containing protein [Methylobacillus caricis]|uniref:prepilin-type N-terminal cleavage/methylation domain-containing protein n=1 Tax=Methylobacillus caricis TaxID=1971611 RepID=UPI001CFF7388|nr:prepilin-type N-terminal cleavage/methylation domain-containing protein [Methylobacillus caricis]MCB5187951.1 prepilin-type N-terminal cleavage/methylation domain-containing protein [Methylobacillus caricis]
MRGFTLIELLVTLVLLALILSSAAPVMQINAKRAKEQELKRDLWQLRDAIDAYKKAVDDGLIKKSPGQSGYPPNLRILVQGVENPRDPKKGKIYFLRSIPRDPFANDPELSAEASWGKRSYASSFDEPAEGDDVYDIYSLSNDKGLDQRPYREW